MGNIRSTIDVTTYVMQEYLASFEVASANLEGFFFDNIDEVRDENPSSADPENEYSARLNGGDPGHEIGASLLMRVMTGDHINVNVNNFYEGYAQNEDEPLTVDDMLDIIVTTLKAGNGGWTGSESHNTNLVDRLFTPSNYTALQQIIDNTANDPSKPKAYLNYILFDEHLNIVPEMSGAYQANGNGTWTGIGTGTAKTMPTNGYFAVFLTNKSKITGCLTCGDVFFDQLVVQVSKGNLLEENHYYPFGLPIQGLSSTALNFKQNRYKYQGNEYIQNGLNWMDFHNRQYDPQLGRFLSVDPLAANTARFSPYTGMNDNPVSMVDPLGLQGQENTATAGFSYQVGNQISPIMPFLAFGGTNETFGALDAYNRECNFWRENARTEKGRIRAMAVLTGTNYYKATGIAAFANNGGGSGIGAGITRGELEAEGWVVDNFNGTAYAVHKWDSKLNRTEAIYAAGTGEIAWTGTLAIGAATTAELGIGVSGAAIGSAAVAGAGIVGVVGGIYLVGYLMNSYASMDAGIAGYENSPSRSGPIYSQQLMDEIVMQLSQGKGERNQTRKADGTDNPYKKLKPDPNKPGNVLEKNSHTGKTTSKPAPPGFWEWWNNK